MKSPPSLLLAATLLTATQAGAAEVFTESFDLEEEAKIEQVKGSGMEVTFVDYSGFTVGNLTHNIPEAPRPIAGSLPTKGVLIRTLYNDGGDPPIDISVTERLANLVALDAPGGVRLELVDNYRLKFDAYLRLSPNVTLATSGIPNDTGTTEHLLWGVGYNSGSPMGRGWRTGRGNGMWGWLTTEGGFGSPTGADASLYQAGTLLGGRNLGNPADDEAYYIPAFGADASPVPKAPANQWVQATVTVLGKQVTVEYQTTGRPGAKFYENVPGVVLVDDQEVSHIAGSVMVGYEDAASSTSFDPDNQWLLVDNMVVEDLTPPTLVVTPTTPLVTFTGTPTTASWSVSNARTTGDLVVSSVTIEGTNPEDFSVFTPLPLIVPAGESGTLTVQFLPAAPNGLKSATLTLATNDPAQPSFSLGTLSARRSVPSFLMAHYKLDETGGTTVADSSPAATTAALQVREPVVFGEPSLLGTADPGTSLGLLPAQTGTSGNYLTAPLTHTPSFTISLWVSPSQAGTVRTLFQRDHNFANPVDKIYALILSPEGFLTYRVGSTDLLLAPEPIPDDAVTHLAVSHLDEDGFGNATATRSRLYINGELAAEVSGEEARGFEEYPLNPVITGLHIGSRTSAGWGYSGRMDDIQIYGVELPADQIMALFQNPGSEAINAIPQLPILASGLLTDPLRFIITFPSSPAGSYTLQRSPDLTTWSPIVENAPGSPGSETTLTDPAPPTGKQYYRVLQN